MSNGSDRRLCSVLNCPQTATEEEHGSSEHWRFTVLYCDEHWRELSKGVPVGPVGLDGSRIVIEPTGTAELRTGGVIGAPD